MTREEIIKGLDKIGDFFRARADMAVGDGKMMLLNWMKCAEEAAEAMRAQEPRVMTPQDFDGNPMKDQYGNLPCWLESREPLVASNWCRWNEDDFIRPMMRNFRPWTSRPTDEQREATPWLNMS